jgi:hypothetical protein
MRRPSLWQVARIERQRNPGTTMKPFRPIRISLCSIRATFAGSTSPRRLNLSVPAGGRSTPRDPILLHRILDPGPEPTPSAFPEQREPRGGGPHRPSIENSSAILAQVWLFLLEAGNNAVGVRNVGAAQAKNVRRAGGPLIVRAQSKTAGRVQGYRQ